MSPLGSVTWGEPALLGGSASVKVPARRPLRCLPALPLQFPSRCPLSLLSSIPQRPLQPKLGARKKRSSFENRHKERGKAVLCFCSELTALSERASLRWGDGGERAPWTPFGRTGPSFPQTSVPEWFPYTLVQGPATPSAPLLSAAEGRR